MVTSLFMGSCSSDEPTNGGECVTAFDCFDGQVCEDGYCVEPTTDQDTPVTEKESLAKDDAVILDQDEPSTDDENDGEPVEEEPVDDGVTTADADEPAIDDPAPTDEDTVEMGDDGLEGDDTLVADEDIIVIETDDEMPITEDDVVVDDAPTSDDDVAPTILSTIPANSANGVLATAKVEVKFSEAMATTSLGNQFTIKRGSTTVAVNAPVWRGVDNTVILTPSSNLQAGAVHTVTVKVGVTDTAGNHLAAQYVFNFTVTKCGDTVIDTGIGEVCDDGVNNGAYGGCMPGCMARAPYCGDGIITAANEACDTALPVACTELAGGYVSGTAVCAAGCQSLSTTACVCPSGYEKGAGDICQDIDECTRDTDGCAQHCQNTDGSHTCSCDSGYTLNADGHACDDKNECDPQPGPCDEHATCTNTVGDYSCACTAPYTGTGMVCQYCGDGATDGTEVCDDGTNDGSYNGCMPGCAAWGPRCGDSATNGGTEECDDGNADNEDACRNDCTYKCRDGWSYYGHHCYKHFTSSVNYGSALSGCQGQGGYLATVSDASENAYIDGIVPGSAWFGYQANYVANISGNATCATVFNGWSYGGIYGGSTAGGSTVNPGCSSSGPEAFVKFTPSVSGEWTIETYADFDNTILLYSGDSCGSYIACYDYNAPADSPWESVSWTLNAGVTYVVVVDGYKGASGSYELYVIPPGKPTAYWWVDWSNGTYTNWAGGEPNNDDGEEYCGQMYDGGTWNDKDCGDSLPYVCEK